VHEANRVFCNRLINDKAIFKFGERFCEVIKKILPDLDQVGLFNYHPPPALAQKTTRPYR